MLISGIKLLFILFRATAFLGDCSISHIPEFNTWETKDQLYKVSKNWGCYYYQQRLEKTNVMVWAFCNYG